MPHWNPSSQSYSYERKKSAVPLVIGIAVIAVLLYVGMGSFQEEYVIVNARVYRPLITGSWDLQFTDVSVERGFTIQPLNQAKDKITFNDLIGKSVHIEMYVDGVKCNVLDGTVGRRSEVEGRISCSVSSGAHTVKLELIDHAGTVRDKKSLEV